MMSFYSPALQFRVAFLLLGGVRDHVNVDDSSHQHHHKHEASLPNTPARFIPIQ